LILQPTFRLIKAPHRKPTISQNNRQTANSSQEQLTAEPSKSPTNKPNMSPRWMMEPEFEIDEYEYYNSDDEKDDEFYYTNNGMSKCIVCMGGNYVRTIYVNYDEEDYDDTNDF
jgi:hypothetical protein